MSHSHWPAMVALLLGCPAPALAQTEIALLSPASVRPALEQVLPAFERTTGNKVKVTFGNGGRNREQVSSGVAIFDVAILQPPYPEVLASGNVINDSATPLATAPIGVAVKQGAVRPDISTPEAVKEMLLAARSVYYPAASSGAAAGVSIDETFKKLGITAQMEPKIKRPQGATRMIGSGEIELYITFLSEMVEPGIEIVGALPPQISNATSFVGFVSSRAKDPDAAKALLRHLTSPEASAVYREHRMVPGR